MSKPQRGDVRKGGDDCLLLVLAVNEEDGYEWCNVMYLHNDVDMATAVDVVMSTASPSFTMLHTCLQIERWVVQTDLYSTCDLSLIGELVGVMGQHETDCLNELWKSTVRAPTVASDYHYVGQPFGLTLEEAKQDPRWKFKEDQGDSLRSRQTKSLEKLLD